MSQLREQHERWKAARARLMGERVKQPSLKDVLTVTVVDEPPKQSAGKRGKRKVYDEDWAEYLRQAQNPLTPRWKRITLELCVKYKVSFVALTSDRRELPLPSIRAEAWWRIRNETTLSYTTIARLFRKDHTTVLYGVEQHEKRVGNSARSECLLREHLQRSFTANNDFDAATAECVA